MIVDRPRWLGLLAVGLAAYCFTALAQADDTEVDLELVLAVDVSRSMDFDEQRLQRDGYQTAFRHPEVIDAIRSGLYGRIAVAYLEWAGERLDRLVVPWTIVEDEASAAAFAEAIDAMPIQPMSRTSISYGLARAAALFEDNGIQGVRRIVDISGDGPNNQGPPVEPVRDRILEKGITINGLPIMLKLGTPTGWFDIADLDDYYEDCVIGGFGAFLIPVTEEAEFAVAIRRKLVLEIAGRQPVSEPRFMRAQVPPPREKMDCLIGEKRWQQRRWD